MSVKWRPPHNYLPILPAGFTNGVQDYIISRLSVCASKWVSAFNTQEISLNSEGTTLFLNMQSPVKLWFESYNLAVQEQLLK